MKLKVTIYIWEGREYKAMKDECCVIDFYIDSENECGKNKIIKDHVSYAFTIFDNISKITIEEEKYI